MTKPGLDCAAHIADGRIGMSDRGEDPVGQAVCGKLLRAGQLRCRRPARNAAVGISHQLQVGLPLRRHDIAQIHAACPLRREVRPFKMHPEQALAIRAGAPCLAERIDRATIFPVARRDRGGQYGGHPVAKVRFTSTVIGFLRAVHEIVPACAVGVQFDQPGRGIQPFAVYHRGRRRLKAGRQYRQDLPVLEQQIPGADGSVYDHDIAYQRSIYHGFLSCGGQASQGTFRPP